MWRVRSLRARDTVAGCTPARSATSLSFTAPGLIRERLSGGLRRRLARRQRRAEIQSADARVVQQLAPARAQLHRARVHDCTLVRDLEPCTRVLLDEQDGQPSLVEPPN